MALLVDDNPSIIKKILDRGHMISIIYVGILNGIEVRYNFIKIESPVEGENPSRGSSSTVLPAGSGSSTVRCISFESNCENPLKLYGTDQPMDKFLKSRDYRSYTKKTMVYPRDWNDCFETDPESRIKMITEELHLLITESEPGSSGSPGLPGSNETQQTVNQRANDRKMINSLFLTRPELRLKFSEPDRPDILPTPDTPRKTEPPQRITPRDLISDSNF